MLPPVLKCNDYRYWAILVENLKRAVDDLYNTCEGDESCMYAREVIMILDTWLKLKVQYENTAPPQRPTSLTWDICKTSPMGKVTPVSTPGKLTPTRQLLLVSPAKRQLEFSQTEGRWPTTASQAGKTTKPVAATKSSLNKTAGTTTTLTPAPPPAGSSSPKQQRISLVARQSMFASEKKNPNRKLSRTEPSKSSRPLTAPSGGKPGGGGDQNRNTINPSGSNTSLSSGSSSRSWADRVRAGLTHLSVEDLSLNLGRLEPIFDLQQSCHKVRDQVRGVADASSLML